MASAVSAAAIPMANRVKNIPYICPGNKNRLNTVKLISTELSINSSEINIAIIFLRVMNP